MDFIEMRSHRPEQPLAGIGRRNAARRAGEEPDAKPFLQAADGMAERGRGDAEMGRRPGEAAFPGDRQERHQIVDRLFRHY